MISQPTPVTCTASGEARPSAVDCSVWWCARPAGHDGDAKQLHGTAIGAEVKAADCTVGVSLQQHGNEPPSVVLGTVVGNGKIHVVQLDPADAARLAHSIDTTETVPADHADDTRPSLIVWLVVENGRSEPLILDSTAAHRVARRLARAASILTEENGWGIPRRRIAGVGD